MTSHWCDFQNADVILHCGSNSAENHPVSAKWLNRAHERGAKWIVVDPRYTRTAELADIYCPIRSGTDIAFYGGLCNYIIEHDLWQHDYVLNYTNASYLLDPDYGFDPATGLYSGFDADSATYSNRTWHYQVESESHWDTAPGAPYAWAAAPGVPAFTPPAVEHPKRDMTLQDPLCVWQQFKKHYSRYDLDTVCAICGMDKETLELVYATYAASGAPDKSGTILYALGQTQHTYGAQNTRAMCIVQLLLGNIGMAGGGVNALRGEPNVQGATDMGMMVNEHPAYLKWPNTTDRKSLRAWMESQTYADGYYTNKPKFLVSSLKEWWGEHATVDNDYGYDWWPKVHQGGLTDTIIPSFEMMEQGKIRGYFNWGMNPANSAPNTANVRQCMSNLDWLVVVDQVATESATFWKAPDMDPASIDTTVFFLPCALIFEKPGLILNSGRWIQYRHQAVEPWDEAKPDYEICDMLWREIRDLYEREGGANPAPVLNAKWDYYVDGKIDPRAVAWALNGYRIAGTDFAQAQVDLCSGYGELAADGSTACAMWIYTGFWANAEAPLDPEKQACCRRGHEDPSGLGLYSDWAFSWPSNRRILYNRASADPEGRPWSDEKVLVEWTGEAWKTFDQPDFVAASNGVPVPPNDNAFFMLWEQNARLESYAMEDGPLPEHYEPFESPTDVNPLNGAFSSPCIRFADFASTKKGTNEEYPIAATTYSVVEHWQTGGQTRMCPALIEAMPTQFIELSPELAAEKGIKAGDKVRVWNNRGSAVVDCVITHRFKPMTVNGKLTHLVGMTHHFGWAGAYATSESMVNDLTPNVGDPNTQVPEYKAFLVDIEKA